MSLSDEGWIGRLKEEKRGTERGQRKENKKEQHKQDAPVKERLLISHKSGKETTQR
jgi:hypothetical protein